MPFDPSDHDDLPREGGARDVELIPGEADTPQRKECLGAS